MGWTDGDRGHLGHKLHFMLMLDLQNFRRADLRCELTMVRSFAGSLTGTYSWCKICRRIPPLFVSCRCRNVPNVRSLDATKHCHTALLASAGVPSRRLLQNLRCGKSSIQRCRNPNLSTCHQVILRNDRNKFRQSNRMLQQNEPTCDIPLIPKQKSSKDANS